MLNLVVGVVCSAMAEATQARKDTLERMHMLHQIAEKTALPVSLLEGWAKVCLSLFVGRCYSYSAILKARACLIQLVI